jgi:large subunit ribosomal protein L22
LRFTPKKAAGLILKTLRSAIANAENNNNLSSDSLIVKTAYVDQGPVLKRFKAAARGTAAPRRKKMSHITVVLSDGVTN